MTPFQDNPHMPVHEIRPYITRAMETFAVLPLKEDAGQMLTLISSCAIAYKLTDMLGRKPYNVEMQAFFPMMLEIAEIIATMQDFPTVLGFPFSQVQLAEGFKTF